MKELLNFILLIVIFQFSYWVSSIMSNPISYAICLLIATNLMGVRFILQELKEIKNKLNQ